MSRYSLIILSIAIVALLLGACGPRTVDQVQPIKFEYTYSEAVAGLKSLAYHFHPLPGWGSLELAPPAQAF